MVAMGIKTELLPDVSGKRTKLPLASWNCKLDETKVVCGSFFGMKVPTGFSSNIRNLVSKEDLKLSKLKSHDHHVVMNSDINRKKGGKRISTLIDLDGNHMLSCKRNWVRGVGGFVKPEAYFHLPKLAKLWSDDSATQSIKKMVSEENNNILAVERAQWAEEKASLECRLMRLEAMLMGKHKQIDKTPKSVTPLNDRGSGQGSCSRLDKAGVRCNEVEGVKVQSSPTVQRCNLVIGSLDNIVAEGTIVQVGVDSSSQTFHGVPLPAENIRVSVTKCLVDNALLPVPVKNDILFVRDAIGTCVAWPKDWVIQATFVGNAKQAPRKNGRKKKKQWVDMDDDFYDTCDLDNLPADLPPALKTLSIWGNEFLKNRATIDTKFSEELF
ncbi:hypothetical protein ACLB2K_040536 [Fragaria x ananassa]